MTNNPLKSVTITGSLYEKQLITKIPLEYFQIYCGVWRVAVADIKFSFEQMIAEDSGFEIRSNLVQGLVFSEQGQLRKNFVILQSFQCSKKASQPLVFHFPNLQWFNISDPDEKIVIEISQWPKSDQVRARKINIALRLLFERIV